MFEEFLSVEKNIDEEMRKGALKENRYSKTYQIKLMQ